MILEFHTSVGEVSASDWNRCAGSLNPFVSHEFLSTLEDSGCVGQETGWIPKPALLRAHSQGPILAVAPCYLKLHSQGEYIFDYHWADAYHRLFPEERSYYPKLQVAVPFTPVPGPRILVDPALTTAQQQETRLALLCGLRQATNQLELSSVHITFCQEEECRVASTEAHYLSRLGEQYHWFNEGYSQFGDFLESLTSRKRKTIKRERLKANQHPLDILTIHGSELTSKQCLAFFRMYQQTSLRKWGEPYLNLQFFQLLAQRMAERFVLFLVQRKDNKRLVAGAWNLRGEEALFGRNWGCLEDYDLLHFEVCYYRAIEYAIGHGLQRVEAGAQGTHKIQRGYRPRPVYSAHYLESVPFRTAIANYLREEKRETQYRLQALSDFEPFKSTAENSARVL